MIKDKDVDLDISKTEITNKLEEIKHKIGLWEIKANISEAERFELNGILELHWKFINLLCRILEREEQFRSERYSLINQYWSLTNDKEERNKGGLLNEIKEGSHKEKKRIKVEINYQLWEKIDKFIKENSSSISLFFNQALLAFKNDPEIICDEIESSQFKHSVAPWLNSETLKMYQNLPNGEKRKCVEVILRSYLEKELENKQKYE